MFLTVPATVLFIGSRQGVNLTVQQEKAMAAVAASLLRQGHSPYQIVTNHPELGISLPQSQVVNSKSKKQTLRKVNSLVVSV